MPLSAVRSLSWQHSLDLRESHRLLAEICIGYLLFTDFKGPDSVAGSQETNPKFIFLDYAASNWADHYRQAYDTISTDLERLALQLCHVNTTTWLRVYGAKRIQQPEFFHELPTSLLVASHFGLANLVNIILRENKQSLNIRVP